MNTTTLAPSSPGRSELRSIHSGQALEGKAGSTKNSPVIFGYFILVLSSRFLRSLFALPALAALFPLHPAADARYWINNALITFRGTSNVATAVAGSEFSNHTLWQITRIKFNRMREFAYRNDGIPRDVIRLPPLLHPFRPLECSLCGGRCTSEARIWDRWRKIERNQVEGKR